MHDVIVVGGGVIGLSVALDAARRGMSVRVLEQGQFGNEASWAGAGLLPAGPTRDTGDPLDRLAAATFRLWPGFSAELQEQTGIDNGFRRCGELAFAADESAETLAETDHWRRAGIEYETLTPEALHQIEPAIAWTGGASPCRIAAAAQVRNPRHLKALLAACHRAGVNLQPGQGVVAIDSDSDRTSAVRTAGERHVAGQFVIAGGAWSTQILSLCGQSLDVEPVRGQIVLLRTPSPPFRHALECGPRYLVPRPDGRILIGSTEEWVGFHKANTAEAMRELLRFATGLVPGLADAQFERAWSGLRPHARRGRPYLGRVPTSDNLFLAAGHFRWGLNLSPITGRLIGQLLAGEATDVPLDDFAVGS